MLTCHVLTLFYFLYSKIDGETLDRALSSKPTNLYTVVLFYASWCPFSHGVRANFDVLSSMFPQIRHLAVEQSSAMPSIFSRYGIHSLPTILIVNQTARMWYLGQKDLSSLVLFYKRTTGLEPVQCMTGDQSGTSEARHPWSEPSLKDALRREPYLGFSVLFLCLRAFLYFYPELLSRLTFLWVSCIPHPSLDILRESSQLLGRILHLIDVKRGWSKLKQTKTRNFHKGAKSARVWASSLTSVSLGETSSGRNPSGLGLE